MNLRYFGVGLFYLMLSSAILFISHYRYVMVALLLVLIPAVISWRRRGGNAQALIELVPEIFIGVSVVVLISLTGQPGGALLFPLTTQILLSVFYGVFILWRHYGSSSPQQLLGVAALSQFTATCAIFLSATYLQWTAFFVVVCVWSTSYLVARWYFAAINESAVTILAATWALVAAQLAWVFYLWLVNYSLEALFIVPQAAIVLLGVGYCFMSIYTAHVQKSLSRRRLIEYLVIMGVMLAIVITGTRWDGTS